MKSAARVVVAALAALATFYLAYLVPLALIPFDAYRWVALIVALICAGAVGRFAWISLGSKAASGLISTMLLWAVIAGGIGFVAGFFGPMIFAPNANQGPLLGIFVTGPLGFVSGGIAGLVRALRQRRSNGLSSQSGHTA